MLSTRGEDSASIDEAILNGLAKDGGLYVPEFFPQYDINKFYDLKHLSAFSSHLLAPFFTNSRIQVDEPFCKQVFSFPLTLHPFNDKKYVLELFHGPTLSFKDFGARFFAQCLQVLSSNRYSHTQSQTIVLVATSGDTGSAVASALDGKQNITGIVLFPKGKISLRQQSQITCWGDNIKAVAVLGTFDQCQQMVKKAFQHHEQSHDPKAHVPANLTTANSINIARLLPQVIFYAYASILDAKEQQALANFIVASGNLGNVTACYWAKAMGFPIDTILIANNANQVLSDYLDSGQYEPRPSIKTLANAMDVGNPSNIERLLYLFPTFDEFKKNVNAISVQDKEIEQAIRDCYQEHHYVICPHTATTYHRLQEVDESKPWIITATAHPAKFHEIIEPLLDISVPVPESLQKLLAREQRFTEIEADYEALSLLIKRL
jgi:threonine synthase